MFFVRYIKGYCKLSIDIASLGNAVALLYDKKLSLPKHRTKGRYAVFICDLSEISVVKSVFKSEGIEILKEKYFGIPSIVKKYKKRPGVYAGVFILLFSLLVSRMFIWQINIKGNENVSRESTIELLREHGIYVGAFAPALNLREIYNRILIDNKDFCWISVNIRGTVANVEVRESLTPQKLTPNEGSYANIVAEYDGEITLVEAYAGQSLVKFGDYVRAGELLVSGIYEDKMGNTVAKYARGHVFARIEKDFYIEIPLQYEQKVYTGEEEYDFSIKIFSKNINILNNSGKTDIKYDIIEENEDICLFDRVKLPISYFKTTYKEYSTESFTRTEAQAKRIAHERINRQISKFAGDGEVLSKDITEECSDGIYKLSIKATVNRDIAKIKEFKFTEG